MRFRTSAWLLAVVAVAAGESLAAQTITLPLRKNSVRFAAIGDVGTGDKSEYDLASIVIKSQAKSRFSFVILLGDNIYGSERPQDFENKFTTPYKPLLDAKIEFHAALGNHDDPNQRFFKPFGMGGERYYSFQKGNVKFYVIDSNYLDPDQVKWLNKELATKGNIWKIAYFHHPLYTTSSRGPAIELRKVLEPMFVKYGVNVVFTGHEHMYERIKPQRGVSYFVSGGGAKLNAGDARPGGVNDKLFDSDRSFMLVEVSGDLLYYQTISRTGATIDKGTIRRGRPPALP